MRNRSKASSRSLNGKRIRLVLILGGACLLSSGCKVPGLRGAKPGPVMPQGYNWNNGLPFWTAPVADTTPAATPEAGKANDKKESSQEDDDSEDSDDAAVWTLPNGNESGRT